MKTTSCSTFTAIIALLLALCTSNSPGAETNAVQRIGIYDSRAVAYAWFWSDRHQKELHELMDAARNAQAAGNTNRFKEFDALLSGHQAEMHREVFSTAPATTALAEIKDRLPDIEKSAGVAALVSKWDDATLAKYPGAEKVDVTGALVLKFITPTPEQQKTISGLEKATPLTREKCEELIRKGEI